MPELPEVELARRDLERWWVGHRLDLDVSDADLVRVGDVAAISGRRAVAAERRGKFLIVRFTSPAPCLVLHLRMTGQIVPSAEDDDAKRIKRTRMVVTAGEQSYRFVDTRRLGCAYVVPEGELEQAGVLARLGPEPWPTSLSGETLRRRFKGSRRPVKVALLDQEVVAGVGNIIASESLWLAQINPRRPCRELGLEALDALGEALAEVCARVLAAEEATAGPLVYVSQNGGGETCDYFLMYGRAGEPCRRCGESIVRFEQSGRSTFACPSCQA